MYTLQRLVRFMTKFKRQCSTPSRNASGVRLISCQLVAVQPVRVEDMGHSNKVVTAGVHNWEMCFANPHGPNYWPGFRPSEPGGATRGGHGNRAGGWGQPRRNQDVHFTKNPVEEAKEHGYEEEPTLQSNMDTEAKGHGGEPIQEEQHWLENYNLDDQE
jgi:hypothetical protein